MPGPEMVQIDPAHKQAPVAAEVFDARQMTLQAKQEVTLLVEKSKNVVREDKPALKNLQTLSSFTVLAKPGHEAETYDIYRKEVSKANELLIHEQEVIGIRLEETKPGKLYIVCGIYEKLEPEIAKEDDKASPLALSAEEWREMKDSIYNAARNAHGREFAELSTVNKLDAIRLAIAPDPSSKSYSSFTYRTSDDPAIRGPHTASETISSKSGDCDDLSVLFVACVKMLENEGVLSVGGVKLALLEYHDPMDNAVKAHANVLQIALNNEEKPEETTILVDLTVRTTTIDLNLPPDLAVGWNPDMRKKMLEHLNSGRKAVRSQIKADNFQMQICGGSEVTGKKYDGVEFYYKEKAGEMKVIESMNQAKGYAESANGLKKEKKLEDAYAMHEQANNMFDDIITDLEKQVELGKGSGGYHADTYVRLADAYYQKFQNLMSESNTIALKTEIGTGNSGEKTDAAGAANAEWLVIQSDLLNMPGLSAFALAGVARNEFNQGREHYAEAERLSREAIAAAPFKKEGYEELYTVLSNEHDYARIKSSFEEYEKTLPLITKKDGSKDTGLNALLLSYVESANKDIDTAR